MQTEQKTGQGESEKSGDMANRFKGGRTPSSSENRSGSGSMASAAAAILEDGKSIFDNVKERGAEVAEQAKHVAENIREKAETYGGRAVDETTSVIRRYPAQSLLVGFGLGLAIGLIASRR